MRYKSMKARAWAFAARVLENDMEVQLADKMWKESRRG